MKHFKPLLGCLILGILSIISACDKDGLRLDFDTFGIRHDKSLQEYENLGQNIAPFTAGNNYPNFQSVCAITYLRDGEPVDGSGVLIDNEWVLSAAHNFVEGNENIPNPTASEMAVLFGTDFNAPVAEVAISELHLHPGWIPNEGMGTESGVDIALLKLSAPLNSIAPTPAHTTTEETLDQKMFVCGFGDYGDVVNTELYSERHAFENILDRIATNITPANDYPNRNQFKGGLIGCDFDSPVEDANTLDETSVDSDTPEVVALGNGDSEQEALNLEGTTVPGDSGGPAFMRINGAWQVVGITSSGSTDSNYGDVAVFTRVQSHQAWMEFIMN